MKKIARELTKYSVSTAQAQFADLAGRLGFGDISRRASVGDGEVEGLADVYLLSDERRVAKTHLIATRSPK